MDTRKLPARTLALTLLLAMAVTAAAQDANITQPVADLERLLAAEPLVITQAEISRPKAKGDITLKADVAFGGAPPLRVKLRKAEPGADHSTTSPLRPRRLRTAEALPRSRRVRRATDCAALDSAGGFRQVPARRGADLLGRRPGAGRAAVLAERHHGGCRRLQPRPIRRGPAVCASHRAAERAHLPDRASRFERRAISSLARPRPGRASSRSTTASPLPPKTAIAAKPGRSFASTGCRPTPSHGCARHPATARAAPRRAGAMEARRRPVRPGCAGTEPARQPWRSARGQGPADGTDPE